MRLLIVESPTKAKTIGGYLPKGDGWQVMASNGHIRNLPEKEHGIAIENGKFVGKWVIESPEKQNLVQDIKKAASIADEIYIATDGDFEGERIASDLIDELRLNATKKPYRRVVFTEITKDHILRTLQAGGGMLNTHSVEAQMARRMLDREIGFPLSQIIRKDFERKGEVALPNGIGRVVSSALAIVVEAEKNRRDFVSRPYKKIFADYVVSGLQVRLTNKVKYFEESEVELEETLRVVRNSPHIVKLYDERYRDIAPPKPLTTSALQRAGFYLFGFEEMYTMKLAQRLFEGVSVYDERIGLITYMRTDSYRIAEEAAFAAIRVNNVRFGEVSTLQKQRNYTNRKGAHGAHEAIRPTQFDNMYWPEVITDQIKGLDDGENLLKLYTFIYNRFLATQLKNATFDRSYIEVEAGGNILSTEANMVIDRGWYVAGGDIINDYYDEYGVEKEVILPEVMMGDQLRAVDIDTIKTQTRTPDRYGRGRFITTLENKGIGRPSTMAGIIQNLIDKNYVYIEHKMLIPTVLGEKVHEWTAEHFPSITEIESAKLLEERLDEIEAGKAIYQDLIREYHTLVEELKLKLGLDPNAPTPGQIDYAQSLAKANGQTLDISILKDRTKIDYYIKNAPRGVTVGKCLFCKKGEVYVNEKLFGCNGAKCNFKLWINGGKGFFERYGKTVSDAELKDSVKAILNNGSVTVDQMEKDGHKGRVVVTIELNRKKDGYWLSAKEFIGEEEISSTPLGEIVTGDDGPVNMVEVMAELAARLEQSDLERRRLQDESFKDPLTRAWNRRKFDNDRTEFFEKCQPVFIAYIDGDKFKSINDTYGHDAGDAVLCYYVDQIADEVRDREASFYRFGGEEFVLVVSGIDEAEALGVLDSIRKRVEGGVVRVDKNEIQTTVSIGYTKIVASHEIDLALKRADEALYDAKSNGRNRIEGRFAPITETEDAKPQAYVW